MSHNHHNHHHEHSISSLNSVFVVAIILNALFVVVEMVVGLYYSSIGLISDAGHNLSDVFSLLLALLAFRLALLPPSKKFTYGYKKSTVLISLVNAVILLVAVGAIVVESVRKIIDPQPVYGAAISWTAAVGIIVNGVTTVMLMRSQKNDLNVRGAFLHMLADTLVSVGVLVSGIIISFTGFYMIDPLIGLAVSAVILISTWKLLSQSVRLTIDGTPEDIDVDDIISDLKQLPGIADVHHVHIWAISTSENAITAHLVLRPGADLEAAKQSARELLKNAGIIHCTLETEFEGTECSCTRC